MRIVGGTFRGRTINAPSGTTTRPTSDRVRESMFSAIEARGLLGEGATILDAFAGSGALGLEALSRGASRVTFIENDRAALNTLRSNVDALGVGEAVSIQKRDMLRTPLSGIEGSPYSLLFLDPPYRIVSSEVRALVQRLIDCGALSSEGAVVWEHDAKTEPLLPVDLEVSFSRRYGSTAVTIAERRGGRGKL